LLRQLNGTEIQESCRQFPVLCAAADLPEDGVVAGVQGVGCVFVFQKVDRAKTRIFVEVSDIWPDCVRQVLPAPRGFWDEVQQKLREVGAEAQKYLFIALGILIVMLALQSGILLRLQK
jgi:hypothetical protein